MTFLRPQVKTRVFRKVEIRRRYKGGAIDCIEWEDERKGKENGVEREENEGKRKGKG
jgi:hypothetical protein